MIDFAQLISLLSSGEDDALIKASQLINSGLPDFGVTIDPGSTLPPAVESLADDLNRLVALDSPLSEEERLQLQPFLEALSDKASSKVSTIDQANEDLGSDSHVIERELANKSFDDTLAITRFLAEGGLGKVWVAKDHAVQREIVLKQLRHSDAGDSTKDRFLHEAQVTAGLEHPNIVPVYGLNADSDGHPYYTMKYVRGDTLADLITRSHESPDRPSELNYLLDVFEHICNAMAYAHSRDIIHRDLKPENIAIGEFGEVLVLDWGLAKHLTRNTGGDATGSEIGQLPQQQSAAGRIMGTPNYMAPEQARGAVDEMDERTDVYALGGVLFEILTGVPPRYKGTRAKDIRTVLSDIQAGHIPTAREFSSSAPKRLEAIASKALSVDANARYQTVRELQDDVTAFRNFQPISSYRESLTEKATRLVARHRLITSVIILTAIMFAGGALAYSTYETYAHDTAKDNNAAIQTLADSTAMKHAETEGKKEQADNSRNAAATRLIAAERDKAKADFLSKTATEKRREMKLANDRAAALAAQASRDADDAQNSLTQAERASENETNTLEEAGRQFVLNTQQAFATSVSRLTSQINNTASTHEILRQVQSTSDLIHQLNDPSITSASTPLLEFITASYLDALPHVVQLDFPGNAQTIATRSDSSLLIAYSNDHEAMAVTHLAAITPDQPIDSLNISFAEDIVHTYPYRDNTGFLHLADGKNQYLQQWDWKSSQAVSPRLSLPHLSKFSIDPRQSFIVIANSTSVIIYDSTSGARRNLKIAVAGDVTDVACDVTGQQLSIATTDGSVYWLDLTDKSIKRYRLPHATLQLAFHVDKSLWLATKTGYLYRWGSPSDNPQVVVKGEPMQSVATQLDNDLRRFVVLGPGSGATIYNLVTGSSIDVFRSHQLHKAAFSRDGTLVALTTTAGDIMVADTSAGAVFLPPTLHGTGLRAFDFAPDNSSLFTLDNARKVRQWSWKAREHTRNYETPGKTQRAWSFANTNLIYLLTTENELAGYSISPDSLVLDSAVRLNFTPEIIAKCYEKLLALSLNHIAVIDANNVVHELDTPGLAAGFSLAGDRLYLETADERTYTLLDSFEWDFAERIPPDAERIHIFPIRQNLHATGDIADDRRIAIPMSPDLTGVQSFFGFQIDNEGYAAIKFNDSASYKLSTPDDFFVLGFLSLKDYTAIVSDYGVAFHHGTSTPDPLQINGYIAASNTTPLMRPSEIARTSTLNRTSISDDSQLAHLFPSHHSDAIYVSENTLASLNTPLADRRLQDAIQSDDNAVPLIPSEEQPNVLTGSLPATPFIAISNSDNQTITLRGLSLTGPPLEQQLVAHVRIQSLSASAQLAITEFQLLRSGGDLIEIKHVTASSSTPIGRPENANDGIKDSDINRGRSTFVSKREFRPWIEFALSQPSLIDRIVLQNTTETVLRHSLGDAVVSFFGEQREFLGSYIIDSPPDPELTLETSAPTNVPLSNAMLITPGQPSVYVPLEMSSTLTLAHTLDIPINSTLVAAIDPSYRLVTTTFNLTAKTQQPTKQFAAYSLPSDLQIQLAPAASTSITHAEKLKLSAMLNAMLLEGALEYATEQWKNADVTRDAQNQMAYLKYINSISLLSKSDTVDHADQIFTTMSTQRSATDALLLLPLLTITDISSVPSNTDVQALLNDANAAPIAKLLGLASYGYITQQHANNIRLIRDPSNATAPTNVFTALVQVMVLHALNQEGATNQQTIQRNLAVFAHNHPVLISKHEDASWPYLVLFHHLLEKTTHLATKP